MAEPLTPVLRLTGEQIGSIQPPPDGDWFVDFDEYEEFVPKRLLDAARDAAPLDCDCTGQPRCVPHEHSPYMDTETCVEHDHVERRAAAPALDVERLMEWLHDLDLTQHYITHETGYDGDDIEGVACIDGLESHREDAVALLRLIEEEAIGSALADALLGVRACIDHGHYLDADDARTDLAEAIAIARAAAPVDEFSAEELLAIFDRTADRPDIRAKITASLTEEARRG